MAKLSAEQINSGGIPDEPGAGGESVTGSPQTIEIRIPAAAEWVRVVRLAVAGVASRLEFSYDDIEDIKLAVTEACNNAILHAATSFDEAADEAPAQPLLVIVQLSLYDDRLEVSVADEGYFPDGGMPQAAVRLVSPHENSPDQLAESGLGLFLIQSLMDSVEHRAGPQQNTTIRMVKYVGAPPDPARDI